MFLCLDESFSSKHTAIGCLSLPLDTLRQCESTFLNNRINEKVWGELKWDKVSERYCQKYLEFLKCYFSSEQVYFHSWVYENNCAEAKRPTTIYKHAYCLIRSVIRKLLKQGFDGSFYIVADSTGEFGHREYKTTQDLLARDRGIHPQAKIAFCDQGDSGVCGAIQVCDIYTGATRYAYSRDKKDPEKADEIVDWLRKVNKGVPINYCYPCFPGLKQFKIHHFLYKVKVPF